MRTSLPLMAAALIVTGVSTSPLPAAAHHSFAVYFDADKDVKVAGTVKSFRFTNPHGLVVLDAVDDQGQHHEWRAETNAPVVLRRRGWTRDIIKPGDKITLEGWPSRDGKRYMRLRSAHDAGGNLIGTAPFGVGDKG